MPQSQNQNQNTFFQMFVDLLRDMFDAENQIVEALPVMAKAASHPELKEAFNQHLTETKNQVQRLKKIFKNLNENPTGMKCSGMQGIIEEAKECLDKKYSTSVLDASLIIGAQKVEHYEIASYGSARSLARHLSDAGFSERIDFDEIADLLQQTLDEESAADEKLTDIADGGFFTQGINDEAQQEQQQNQNVKQTKSSSRNK